MRKIGLAPKSISLQGAVEITMKTLRAALLSASGFVARRSMTGTGYSRSLLRARTLKYPAASYASIYDIVYKIAGNLFSEIHVINRNPWSCSAKDEGNAPCDRQVRQCRSEGRSRKSGESSGGGHGRR
jgi:hypothetical protein